MEAHLLAGNGLFKPAQGLLGLMVTNFTLTVIVQIALSGIAGKCVDLYISYLLQIALWRNIN